MRILGIDPGTSIIGFGLIDFDGENYQVIDFGTIVTSGKIVLAKKLETIVDDLKLLIKEHKPDFASVEKLFFNKNVKTAISVAEARGVITHTLSSAGLPVTEYTPLQIKSAVTGYGKAGKQQIQEMVRIILKLKQIPKPDDAADALAVAICHANHYQHASHHSIES